MLRQRPVLACANLSEHEQQIISSSSGSRPSDLLYFCGIFDTRNTGAAPAERICSLEATPVSQGLGHVMLPVLAKSACKALVLQCILLKSRLIAALDRLFSECLHCGVVCANYCFQLYLRLQPPNYRDSWWCYEILQGTWALSDALPPGTHLAQLKEQQKSPIFKPELRSQIFIESEPSLRKPYLMTINIMHNSGYIKLHYIVTYLA
jgi:hypothetical protein